MASFVWAFCDLTETAAAADELWREHC
jgi:hypothetical protein